MAKKKTAMKPVDDAVRALGAGATLSYTIRKDGNGKVKIEQGARASPGIIRASAIAVAAILDRCLATKDHVKVIRLAKKILAAVEG